jgi:hypothetical protein
VHWSCFQFFSWFINMITTLFGLVPGWEDHIHDPFLANSLLVVTKQWARSRYPKLCKSFVLLVDKDEQIAQSLPARDSSMRPLHIFESLMMIDAWCCDIESEPCSCASQILVQPLCEAVYPCHRRYWRPGSSGHLTQVLGNDCRY